MRHKRHYFSVFISFAITVCSTLDRKQQYDMDNLYWLETNAKESQREKNAFRSCLSHIVVCNDFRRIKIRQPSRKRLKKKNNKRFHSLADMRLRTINNENYFYKPKGESNQLGPVYRKWFHFSSLRLSDTCVHRASLYLYCIHSSDCTQCRTPSAKNHIKTKTETKTISEFILFCLKMSLKLK